MQIICAECHEWTASGELKCVACGGQATLEGRYVLEEVIGSGAQGLTFRARRIEDGQVVAIKEFVISGAEKIKALELFFREAATLESLDHPGIPAYLEHFEGVSARDRVLYLVQEYVDGETLAEEAKSRRYSEEDVRAIWEELLEIFDDLHHRDPAVIHRDIKPSNVMRRRGDGRLMLIDFGAVRQVFEEQGGSTVAGTFGYMAPEQFIGEARPATDIYGLGAMGLALLARQEPSEMLSSANELQWEDKVDVSLGMRRVLRAMLMRSPEERLQSAAEVRGALDNMELADEPEAGGPAKPRAGRVRNRVLILIAIVGAIYLGRMIGAGPVADGVARPGELVQAEAMMEESLFAPGARQACEAGDGASCHELAFLYLIGLRGEPSFEEALRYYEMGCRGYHAPSCLKIIELSPKTGDEALSSSRILRLREMACEMGDDESCMVLAEMYVEGVGGPVDEEGARKALQWACDVERAEGCLSLATLFLEGIGGEVDEVAGHQALMKACDLGLGSACVLLVELRSTGER